MKLTTFLTALGLIILLDHDSRALLSSEDPDFFCKSAKELLSDFNWVRLYKGERLGNNEAIVTCQNSTATIRSNAPFGSSLQWIQQGGSYSATIPSETALAIRSTEMQTDQPNFLVEVINVSGSALYSQKKDLIRDHYQLLETVLIKRQDFAARGQERLADLKRIGWGKLQSDHVLEEWDMVWIQREGLLEIEITEYGPNPYTAAGTDVKDSAGKYTHRKRFLGDSFFIMNPSAFKKAKVNSITGEVWVATNKDKVKDFFGKYRIDSHRTAPSKKNGKGKSR